MGKGKAPSFEEASRARVAEKQLADRIARAQAKAPPQDPTGEHHESIAIIARHVGRDVGDLLDEWHERAAAREYGSESPNRAEAERLAVLDVEAAYAPAQGLLL